LSKGPWKKKLQNGGITHGGVIEDSSLPDTCPVKEILQQTKAILDILRDILEHCIACSKKEQK